MTRMSRWSGVRALSVMAGAWAVVLPMAGAGPAGAAPQTALQWGSCEQWFDTAEVPTAECTTVAVPVDYANAQGPQANLAVLRIPASGDRIGTLISNPGGPGISAVDVMTRFGPILADTAMGERFDLVAIDPRGVGFSTPELRCETDAERDEDRRDPNVDFSPAGVAAMEQESREDAQRCLDRMGAPFLANMTTEITARDMDAVRAALGEEQVNFLGYSYGTRLGTSYADQFPDRVRAMMLDGVVDQSETSTQEILTSAAGFQQAFDAYAADCTLDADCPLGTDPADTIARFHQLVDPLVAHPAPTADPRGLSYQDALTATDSAMYSDEDWPALTEGLAALRDGTEADALLELADSYYDRTPDGRYPNVEDVLQAVHCVDETYSPDPAVWVEADRQRRELAPYESYGPFTGFAPRPQCVFWPVPSAGDAKPATSPGPGKVVVVSTTGDPATPYQSGVDVAAALGAPLITYEGEQHTVAFTGVECIDRPLIDFFVDRVQPPADLRC
jgi:pimeloyl-ACP methyl ester carboxylesterase